MLEKDYYNNPIFHYKLPAFEVQYKLESHNEAHDDTVLKS